jgi:hypothetical protein
MSKTLIREFFAVTRTSIYQVSRDEADAVTVKKIKLHDGKHSAAPVGISLKRDAFLAVTHGRGLFFYHDGGVDVQSAKPPGHGPLAEEVNPNFWQNGTSSVIALFLKEEDANRCLASGVMNIRDVQWRNCTEAVLRAINGDPIIRASRSSSYAFPADFFAS